MYRGVKILVRKRRSSREERQKTGSSRWVERERKYLKDRYYLEMLGFRFRDSIEKGKDVEKE